MSKKKSILKEFTPEQPEYDYIPTAKEVEVMDTMFPRFISAEHVRNAHYAYLDSRNIVEYINDSVRRFTTNTDERDYIEDWQARVHVQTTRNKTLAILGKLVSVLPIAQFKGRGDEDMRKGVLLTNLYEYAEEEDDYDELMTFALLEAIVKGTVIGYEGVEIKTRKIRNVKGGADNITVSEVNEKKTTLPGSIVPLEDFYPSSIGIRSIKKMPFCFWRSEIPFEEFIQDWSMYKRHTLVRPFAREFNAEDVQPFYKDYISGLTKDGNVEILRYYDRENDQFVISANGIWLNPLKNKEEEFVVSPLPFNHKELPFWDVKFDFFGSDFFYGKSLPDRLKSMQDVLNVLTNMSLDQSFLTIFPPILMAGFDDIEDDYLRPGRRIPVDTGGLPLNQSFMKLDPGTPSGWHQFILQYTRDLMEEASVDKVQQGVAGVGERTTAREISVAAEGVSSILGLFGRMVNSGIKRKAYLKGANILQFWTDPKSPMLQQLGGEEGKKDFKKIFNTYEIDNTTLTDGKRGLKIIEFYKNKKFVPNKKILETRAALLKAEKNTEVEVFAVAPEYIRDFKYDIKLVTNVKSEGSKEVEKALQLEKVRVYLSFFPELVDKVELAAQTAEKMGDDPTKVLKPDVINPQPLEKNNELDRGVSQNPTENVANNMARSVKGGEGAAQLAQIQASMQG